MGGYGSGGARLAARVTTEDCSALRVSKLRRAGALAAGWYGTWSWLWGGRRVASITLESAPEAVTLAYRTSRGEDVRERVALARTPCHYGGSRAWFLCPGCDRRVGVLYLRAGLFRCRHCHHLAYRSTHESPLDRAFRRVARLRERLGCRPGVIYPRGPKPRGMHWRTYLRLSVELDHATAELLELVQGRLECLSGGVREPWRSPPDQ